MPCAIMNGLTVFVIFLQTLPSLALSTLFNGGPSLKMPTQQFLLAWTLLFLAWWNAAYAQPNPTLWPSWLPLAVRSPYLNAWLNSSNKPLVTSGGIQNIRAPEVWPSFWNKVRAFFRVAESNKR